MAQPCALPLMKMRETCCFSARAHGIAQLSCSKLPCRSPGSAGKARSHKSRTRSNRPLWASTECHIRRSRKRTGKRPLASFPSIDGRTTRNDPDVEDEHRHDHRKIIGAGITAMRAVAPPRVQQARRAHPDEGDDPDHGASRYRSKQTAKNGRFRHPPRQQAGAHAAKPVASGLARCAGHRRLLTAGGSARLTRAYRLNGRTRHRAVGAEHAAIPRLGL